MSIDETVSRDFKFNSRKDHMIEIIQKKLEKSNKAFLKAHQNFIDIENQADQQTSESKNENGRRRKSNGIKSFEFQTVSSKETAEDLSLIYEGQGENFNSKNFRKGEIINCFIDKKKMQGTIATVNQKGIVVVSKDRRKIRITWDEIEDEEILIERVSEEV